MRLDPARLAAAAAEASAALASRVVRRVRDRGSDSALIETSAATLLVSWRPGCARLHLATRTESRPAVASSPFVQQLKAEAEGARVVSVSALFSDRVADVTLDGPGGDGNVRRVRLVLEAFGTRSNAFLLLGPDDVVLAVARPRSARGRVPGATYVPPPPPPHSSLPPAFLPGAASFTSGAGASSSASIDLEREGLVEEAQRDLEARRSDAARLLRAGAARLDSRRSGLEHDLEEALRAPRYRLFGEMLRAAFGSLRKGATEVVLPDYTDPEARPVAIPLDPAVPPAENIRRYFQKAKKGAAGEPLIRRQIAAVVERRREVGALEEALRAAASLDDLAALDDRLRAVAPPARRQPSGAEPGRPSRRATTERMPYREFRSADGLPILVGRTAAENDRLTFHVARGGDTWLHVTGGPGAHVVVRTPKGKSVPLETLLDAAALAIHHCPRRDRGGAFEVVYAAAKNVRKPRGAPPGRVTIAAGKTLRLAYDSARAKRLLGGDDTAP